MLEIINRTSYRSHLQQPPTVIQTPIKTQAETWQEIANNIRIKRQRRSTVTVVAKQAEEERPFKLTFKNKKGIECDAYPTGHAIKQFSRRIRLLKPHLIFENRKELMLSFCQHFMKSERISERGYNLRNKKRREGDTPFATGVKGNYAFIVKPDGTILTFELIGKHRPLNKIHSTKKMVDTVE